MEALLREVQANLQAQWQKQKEAELEKIRLGEYNSVLIDGAIQGVEEFIKAMKAKLPSNPDCIDVEATDVGIESK